MTNKLHKWILMKAMAMTACIAVMVACSTVDCLPENEKLYTGIKKTEVHGKKGTEAENVALTEVKAALAYAPNNALFGSSSRRTPLPIGLWVHDSFLKKENPRGFSKWTNKLFGSEYVTVSAVNPQLRTQVATNTLQNYGYFNGEVNYELINDKKNPKKQKIKYDILLREPYIYDKVNFAFRDRQDSIVEANTDKSYVKVGEQFSTANLELERSRITELLKNNGYYYFKEDYISYFADSAKTPQMVDMMITPHPDAPQKIMKQMSIGDIKVYIRNNTLNSQNRNTTTGDSALTDSARRARMRIVYDDSVMVGTVKFLYQGQKAPISPKVVRRNILLRSKMLYRKRFVDITNRNLSSMQVFRQIAWTFTPRDTTATCDTLDVTINLTLDQPINVEAELSFTAKNNDQIGPRGKVSFTKHNAFGRGETLALDLVGSYEWQTKTSKRNGRTPPDSYEAGLNGTLTYPWLVFPGLSKKRFRYPTSTDIKANIDHINRAGYYRLVTFGIEADYNFQTSRFVKHQFVPLTVKYNHLLQTSEEFDSLTANNSALYLSLKDQFIPGIQYTYTFDNSTKENTHSMTHFDITFKEAGNIISGVSSIWGKNFSVENKEIFGNPYAQFLKVNGQLINYFKLTDNSTLATRIKAGIVWTYGNSSIAPISEMFYVGGANSIRAFTARSIGPGAYHDPTHLGTYLDQAGDILLEANAEYRFKLVSNLYGALFLDAGNVWLLRKDDSHPFGKFGDKGIFDTVALGTGFGIRYDLEFLMLRLDLGIAIHAPYDTGKSGYYNIRKFNDGIGLHFAVGLPF